MARALRSSFTSRIWAAHAGSVRIASWRTANAVNELIPGKPPSINIENFISENLARCASRYIRAVIPNKRSNQAA